MSSGIGSLIRDHRVSMRLGGLWGQRKERSIGPDVAELHGRGFVDRHVRETVLPADGNGLARRWEIDVSGRRVRKQECERQAEHEPIDWTAHDVDSLPCFGKKPTSGR